MVQTAYGSLTIGLDLQPGQSVLIRGGIRSEPSTCAFRPDVTLCRAIGRGLAGRAGQPGRLGPD
jgi:hypothetical protein